MTRVPRRKTTITVTEERVESLRQPRTAQRWRVIQLQPPATDTVPATITPVIQGIREHQSALIGLRNVSPVIAVELHRAALDTLTYQVAVPTARLERKLRTHLSGHIPGIGFSDGTTGLPVTTVDTLGGALLTLGRDDWYPLRTEFPEPALNAVVGALHPHAMKDMKIVLQILLRPVAGHPVGQWWYRKRAFKQLGYLTKEKESLWGNRRPTKRERQQANAIEAKVTAPLWWCSIRLVVIGAGEHTRSRIREVTGAFAPVENPVTSQFIVPEPVRVWRARSLADFATVVAQRRFGQWSRKFRLSNTEVGALCAVPSREQSNLQRASPQ